ncbi:mitochondrial genome maintenance exonuclease 1 [Trichomycterus rosablanca]|uniref:mitochondrial genome maintenance exonuclease 1 n=1 Tax=Trichomycterus rosablanca TaxID=2290929 RepID=UPI002F356198
MRVYRLWQHSVSVRHVSLINGQLSCAFSSFHCLRARKKSSQYSSVDTEHYSSLVKTVVSTRTSSQTPESIEHEDQCLYGSIVKSKAAQLTKVLKNPCPLLNEAKISQESDHLKESITRINLQRGSSQVSIPSVTKILQKTMSEQQLFYLERWKRRKIAELGEEGFKQYTMNLFRQGRLFHAAIDVILTGENLTKEEDKFTENLSGYLQSIGHVLDVIREVKAIESVVQHQALQYRGIVDCVATYKDSLCVIDWKTSERPKPLLNNTYDNPLQVVAYIGALNSDSNYNFQVKNGLIVVAYDDGSPAHCHFLNADLVAQYWEKWLFRLEKYMENVVHPSSS